MIKKLFLAVLLSFVLFISCKHKQDYTHIQGSALGTTFQVKYESQVNYEKAIDSLFGVINHSMSTYHKNSIISTFNSGIDPVEIDTHFKEVYLLAKNIYDDTNGLFDPTIGTLVNAWGFGPDKNTSLPDSIQVDSLLQFIGMDKLKLENNTLHKLVPNVYIDFNAIAKGYAVDVIADFLENKNITNYMVEIGGEIRAKGKNPKQKNWVIGIEKPLTDGTRNIAASLALQDEAMATSGNYRRFKVDEYGNKFVHTINPITGFTEQNDLLSTTVISKANCATADAYATALMVMGFEQAKDFLSSHPELKAILMYIDTDGSTQIYDPEQLLNESYATL